MFVIKDTETNKFAKHTGQIRNEETYPWTLVNSVEDASQYETLEHANEIAFWELDTFKKWSLVNIETGEEMERRLGKYFPGWRSYRINWIKKTLEE